MNNTIRLEDLNFEYIYDKKVPILDESILQHELSPNVRIFYHVPEEKEPNPGFRFVVLEWCHGGAEDDVWTPDAGVEYFAHGIAYFDGVRHLYFGHEDTQNEGYLYYPHVESLKLLAEWFQDMEKKYCYES